jgi:flagellar biosynthesis chaperone FliJ
MYHTVVFPPLKPASRKDVVVLGEWLENQMGGILAREISLKNAGKRAKDAPGELQRVENDQAECLNDKLQIFTLCLNEIVRQVTLHCAERGDLLGKVWGNFTAVFDHLLQDMQTTITEHDHTIEELENELQHTSHRLQAVEKGQAIRVDEALKTSNRRWGMKMATLRDQLVDSETKLAVVGEKEVNFMRWLPNFASYEHSSLAAILTPAANCACKKPTAPIDALIVDAKRLLTLCGPSMKGIANCASIIGLPDDSKGDSARIALEALTESARQAQTQLREYIDDHESVERDFEETIKQNQRKMKEMKKQLDSLGNQLDQAMMSPQNTEPEFPGLHMIIGEKNVHRALDAKMFEFKSLFKIPPKTLANKKTGAGSQIARHGIGPVQWVMMHRFAYKLILDKMNSEHESRQSFFYTEDNTIKRKGSIVEGLAGRTRKKYKRVEQKTFPNQCVGSYLVDVFLNKYGEQEDAMGPLSELLQSFDIIQDAINNLERKCMLPAYPASHNQLVLQFGQLTGLVQPAYTEEESQLYLHMFNKLRTYMKVPDLRNGENVCDGSLIQNLIHGMIENGGEVEDHSNQLQILSALFKNSMRKYFPVDMIPSSWMPLHNAMMIVKSVFAAPKSEGTHSIDSIRLSASGYSRLVGKLEEAADLHSTTLDDELTSLGNSLNFQVIFRTFPFFVPCVVSTPPPPPIPIMVGLGSSRSTCVFDGCRKRGVEAVETQP